jgi:uncharacterized protein
MPAGNATAGSPSSIPPATWAVVTGASSGIGEAFARRLAQEGRSLLLVARRGDRLQRLADALASRHGVTARPLAADLATDAGVAEVAAAVSALPSLAVLAHCAGFGTRALVADQAPERLSAMVSVHDLAAVRLVRAALPAMLSAGRGAIVLVSSLAAFFTTRRYTMYSATKVFLNRFAEGLQAEVAEHGVVVRAVCPGLTRTEFLTTPEYAEFEYAGVPAAAWMTADAVVDEAMASLRGSAVVVIPGRMNRMAVSVLRAPVLGPLVMAALARFAGDRF